MCRCGPPPGYFMGMMQFLRSVCFFLFCLVCHWAPSSSLAIFQNPHGAEVDKVITWEGRCLTYPRCLAFECCAPSLLDAVHTYWRNSHDQYPCMHTASCDYSVPLAERMRDHPLTQVELTVPMLQQGQARFPVCLATHLFSSVCVCVCVCV